MYQGAPGSREKRHELIAERMVTPAAGNNINKAAVGTAKSMGKSDSMLSSSPNAGFPDKKGSNSSRRNGENARSSNSTSSQRNPKDIKRSNSSNSAGITVYSSEIKNKWTGSSNSSSRPVYSRSDSRSCTKTSSLHTIVDVQLSKLLRSVTKEDTRDGKLRVTAALGEFLDDVRNIRTIQKTGENLWEALLELISDKSTHKPVRVVLETCMARSAAQNIGVCKRFVEWLFQSFNNSCTSSEVKVHLMGILLHFLVLTTDSLNPPLEQLIMDQVQKVLEDADNGTVIIGILKIVLYFATNRPDLFTPLFNDVVDILVGWHLEVRQSESTVQEMSDALLALRGYWVADMDFCLTLTGQFLEDVENYSKDFLVQPDSENEECLSKITLLLRVFCTIVKSAGESYNSKTSPVIKLGSIAQSAHRIIACIENLKANLNANVVIAANECLSELLSCGEDLTKCGIQDLIKYQITDIANCSHRQQISSINLLNQLLKYGDTTCLVGFVDFILGAELDYVKYSYSKKVVGATHALFHRLFSLKNMLALQLTYKHVKEAVEASLAALSGSSVDQDWREDGKSGVKPPPELCILFHLSSLSEVSTDTSNLILMYALEPSLFELVLQEWLLSNGDGLMTQPLCRHAILHLLHIHCSSHGNFIAKSSLLSKEEVKSTHPKITVSNSSGDNFVQLLESFPHLIEETKAHPKSLALFVLWMKEILEKLINVDQNILRNNVVHNALIALLKVERKYMDKSMLLDMSYCTKTMLKVPNLPQPFLVKLVDFIYHSLADESNEVQERFMVAMSDLSLNHLYLLNRNVDEMPLLCKAHELRAEIMRGAFGEQTSEAFRVIAANLFRNFPPDSAFDTEWLQRLLLGSLKATTDKEEIIHHRGLLEYWLLWQAADFCVANKLKTPMGRAPETFTCIENTIKQLTADSRNKTLSIQPGLVSMLLQFMENLEKVLYNAYEGTAGPILTTHSKFVRTFFRTNRATCMEWLTRVRLQTLSLASIYGCPTTVMRHGYELITDMQKSNSLQTPEFEFVLVYLADACYKLNCPEVLQGLYAWCKEFCSKKIHWLKPAATLAFQKFEQAADEFLSCMKSQTALTSDGATGDGITIKQKSSSLTSTPHICARQITECYAALQSWEEAEEWLNTFALMAESDESLATADPVSDMVKTQNMLSSVSPDLLSWSAQQVLSDIWHQKLSDAGDIKQSQVHETLSHLFVREVAHVWPPYVQSTSVLAMMRVLGKCHPTQIIAGLREERNLSSLLLAKEYFMKCQLSEDQKTDLLLTCCRRARQTDNLKLGKRLILELSGVEDLTSVGMSDYSSASLRIQREAAKQLHETGKLTEALQIMSAAALACDNVPVPDSAISELSSRSTLTIVKWLHSESKLVSTMFHPEQNNHPSSLKLFINSLPTESASSVIPQPEKVIGQLLHLSTAKCPSLAKAWFGLAGWCYKWGRKCLDAHNADSDKPTAEQEAVEKILDDGVPDSDKEVIRAVMFSGMQGDLANEEDLNEESAEYGDNDQEIRKRLTACCFDLAEDKLEELVQIWVQSTKRVYFLYEEAANAYFAYLKLSSTVRSSDESNVTSTLRLLRLLVKHAWELQEVLETGLSATPTAPWKKIIPQLFSRLNHPELYVRHSVADLLCRLAQDSPHLIVYPAIVGSKSTTGSSAQYDDAESSDTEDTNDLSTEGADLKDCFQSLVDTLAEDNPKMIQEVQTLVREFCRITVLWDELWLGSLNQLHGSVSEKIKSLAAEVERVKKNTSLSSEECKLLIHEKRATIVKPLIHSLERLNEITSQTAETNHEKWFQTEYDHLIKKGLTKLKNPDSDEELLSCWQPFKQLHSMLQQRSQKRASHMLRMKDVSSTLAGLRGTGIPMPGLFSRNEQPITLEYVHSTVQILPTKTKPKKLAFQGSDGQKYTYLFKGLEDLHLDERIMQFLTIVNDMLTPKCFGSGDVVMYRARHYSVTPLGLRSGLIHWVDGCVALFSLYKRWQVREAASQNRLHSSSANNVQRPSEVFYSKLIPLIKPLLDDRGIRDVKEAEKIRKDWPLSALVAATQQLIADTPSSLVSKELWCHSTTANEWWCVTETYCRSVAVMSTIGYILGLGDRHLDNLLLDMKNGEVVHIDYNVCFDKGKSLRVPERVPFRLTQNVVAAMGATGVEGLFRSACEHVMKTMRGGRETLLTLLEAFVYDPLVDWTVGSETGLAGAFYGGNYAVGSASKDYRRRKKQMEHDITASMFSIRVTEMKAAWLQNKEDLRISLKEMLKRLTNISEELGRIQSYTRQAQQCEELLQYLAEVKQDGGSGVHKIQEYYSAHNKRIAAKQACMKEMETFVAECERSHSFHQSVIDAVTSPVITQLASDLTSLPKLTKPVTSSTVSFLQSVGQTSQLTVCEQLEAQLVGLLAQRSKLTAQCIESLRRYAAVVSQFPSTYSSDNIMAECMRKIKSVQKEFTLESCQSALDCIDESKNFKHKLSHASVALLKERNMQLALSTDTAKLQKLIDRSESESLSIELLINNFEEKKTLVNQLIAKHGSYSVMVVIIPKLVDLCKRFLKIESAASGAAARLVDLTSRDGDWFLDELTSITDNIVEYLSLMKINETGSADELLPNNHGDMSQHVISHSALYKVIQSIQMVYISLQEMIQNFQSIILPEVTSHLCTEEGSVISMIRSLREDVIRSRDLKALCTKLETSLTKVIFGQEPDSESLAVVEELQQAFLPLVNNDDGMMTAGKMLMKAFNGLFIGIRREYERAFEARTAVNAPKPWSKVDVIREAGSLQQTPNSEHTRQHLSSIFLVKQLQVMDDFFSVSKNYAAVFTDLEHDSIQSSDSLSRPVKAFIADFVRKQLLGVASQCVGYLLCDFLQQMGLDVNKEIALRDIGASSKVSIEDLFKKITDQRGVSSPVRNSMSQTVNCVNNFDTAWRRQDLAKRLARNIKLVDTAVQQQQRAIFCYQWLNEELLQMSTGGQFNFMQPCRNDKLVDLHKSMQALSATTAVHTELLEKLAAAEASISQRLRWAAGANPSLNTTLCLFESSQMHRTSAIQKEAGIVRDALSYSHYILHMESMRSKTAEASNIASKCKQLLEKVLELCSSMDGDEKISESQLFLMSLLSKSDRQKTGNAFLLKATECVQKHQNSMNSKVRGLNKSVSLLMDKYQAHVSAIQYGVLNGHHKLISEVRAVLKTLAKEEAEDSFNSSNGIQEYLKMYKLFSEKLSTLLKKAASNQIAEGMEIKIKPLVEQVDEEIEYVFDRLLELAKPLSFTSGNNKSESTTSGRELDDMVSTQSQVSFAGKESKSTSRLDKMTRDPKTGKAVQERNSYAVSVWRRVKMKLDGRELDPNKRMSVTDQVDYIVSEAVNVENLAQMYEGWTSWV